MTHLLICLQLPHISSPPYCCSSSFFLLQLAEMIEEADRNGDGEVDAEEFLRIMKKTALF